MSHRLTVHVTPKSKYEFAVFASKIQLMSKEVCCKVSLCENLQWKSWATSFLYITVHLHKGPTVWNLLPDDLPAQQDCILQTGLGNLAVLQLLTSMQCTLETSWQCAIQIYYYHYRQVQAYECQVTLRRGVVRVTLPISNFAAPMISQEWLKLELSNFAHWSTVVSHSFRMTKPPLKRAWSGSRDPFSILLTEIISPEQLMRESPNFICS